MTGQIASAPGNWRPLMALILASVVVMGSPGPSTISVTAAGAAFEPASGCDTRQHIEELACQRLAPAPGTGRGH